ncbi:signal peptide peptidase SppA [Marinimicrobium sp. ARAG 43.8]|uniref:signal peptide peptidase SppA n=1 Tax=Marinimicrobium sp. ARAG 43.8 TaxID=3418719 RepID=UPI003CFA965E
MSYNSSEYSRPARRRGPVRRFFHAIGRALNWLRVILANVIFVAVLLFIVIALLPKEPVPLPEQFALTIAPTGFLVDEASYVDPVNLLLGSGNQPMETPVQPLIDALDAARTNERVTGVVLELDGLLGGGISKLEEIGAAVQRFKQSDKPVVAVGSLFTQDQYYLASYADEIYMDPMGSVVLTGYANYRVYFKDALDKLAVNFHIFRSGKYKDFVEPFTRNDMSAASREHNQSWLNQLWGVYTSRVEAQRQLPSGAIDDYISAMDEHLAAVGGDGAQLALQMQLVDGILNVQEREQMLVQRFGFSDYYGQGYNGLDPHTFLADMGRHPSDSQGNVAVIAATGTITTGEQPEGSIGSDTFRQHLQQVRDDASIKALVVRIDSGGGSAYASEVIRTELASLRAEGMPVLISMGSMAASGGYWIAMGADEIWATPTTLTGSIGVFGALPTFEDSLEKLGVHVDGVATTPLAGSMRLDRTLTPQAERVMQQTVDHIYQQFLDTVAQARGLTAEQVDQLGQGRVWTGATARELGLVDHLGGLEDTIAAAASHAGLEDYEVQVITRPPTPYEQLAALLSQGGVSAALPEPAASTWVTPEMKRQLAPLLAPLRALAELDDPRMVYARCMECLSP